MKTIILIALGLFFIADATAQVIFRNDWVIRGKSRLKNLGLTHITINLDGYPNFNQLVNGKGGRTLVIDVRAVRGTKTKYTYTEIADMIYVPPVRNLQHNIHDPSLNHYYFLRSFTFRPLLHNF